MRLLMLKEALPTGGAERQLALIMKHLPPYWERRVWVMGGGPFVDAIAADGHRVEVCPRTARFDVRPAGALWRLLLAWRPDVVHSWDWMSTLAALPLCRLLGIPIVDATIRNGIVRRKGSLQRRAKPGGIGPRRGQQPGGPRGLGRRAPQGPSGLQRLRPRAPESRRVRRGDGRLAATLRTPSS